MKKYEKLGVYHIETRAVEGQLEYLNDAIATVRRSIKSITKLEQLLVKKEVPTDKTEGRNRYSVAFGRE